MKKRLTALLLSLLMLVAMLPVSAFAEGEIVKYTVLVLDCSGSMGGDPATAQKEAAKKFCDVTASGTDTNYIAIVRLSSSSSPSYLDFTLATDQDTLYNYIDGTGASGGTSYSGALERAYSLLANVSTTNGVTVSKNIVFCSDGYPENGKTSTSGLFTSSDNSQYEYANAAVQIADEIRNNGVTIYALGFFHEIDDDELPFCQRVMEAIAGDASRTYNITSADDSSLTYALGDIAENASGAGHTLVKHDLVPATYTSAGSIEYYQCTGCGRYFTDANATHEVSAENVTIPVMQLFSDVSYEEMGGDWFYPDIEYVASNGIMNGTGNNYFSPYVITTRAMMVTILYRIEGQPKVTGTSNFTDVAEGKWYADAVAWGEATGIVKGYSADIYAPDDTVTREQAVTMMQRYAAYRQVDVSAQDSLEAFSDAGNISGYADSAVRWAVSAGLLKGTNKGMFLPRNGMTRAEMTAVVHRFCENIVPLFQEV